MKRGPLGPGSRGRDDRHRSRRRTPGEPPAGEEADRRDGPQSADAAQSHEGPPRERVHAGRPLVIASIHRDTSELQELARTLGLRLVLEVWQNRNRPHPGSFLGRGKLQQLKGWLDEWKAGLVPGDWRWAGTYWVPEESGKREEPAFSTSWGGWRKQDGDEKSTKGPRPGPPGGGVPDPEDFADHDLLVVVDEDVRPAVLFNMEEVLGVEVWGRTRLILEIFSQHAHLKEARLQVELAQLRYDVPMVHEAIHRKRRGERPGFMGGGEYAVADYEDFIKRRMRTIRDELKRVRHDRAVRRKVRRDRFYLVSLAGYTNAGKSSLLSALTGAKALQESALFSTLGTMTRRLDTPVARPRGTAGPRVAFEAQKDNELDRENRSEEGDDGVPEQGAQAPTQAPTQARPQAGGDSGGDSGTPSGTPRDAQSAAQTDTGSGDARMEDPVGGKRPRVEDSTTVEGEDPFTSFRRPVLVTDTVGFIRALPSWLVEAFHATLEEIALADVVLLVTDVSDPQDVLLEKVRVGLSELAHLDVTCPILLVLNKTDLVSQADLEEKARLVVEQTPVRPEWVMGVSAREAKGLQELVGSIQDCLPPMVGYRVRVSGVEAGQRLMGRLKGWGEVQHVDYGKQMDVEGVCDPIHWKDLQREAQESGVTLERISS